MNEALAHLSREQLEQLAEAYAKNAIALDGVWFQATERDVGMEAAMRYDCEAWERFGLTEARRLKALLGLGEHPGLDGLAAALPLRFQSVANACTVRREEGAVVYRIETCRVQQARHGKGLGYHPCKQVGVVEHPAFARGIDERLACTCLSCDPHVTDDTCSCAWRFTLRVP